MLDTRPGLVIAFTLIAGGTPGTRHTLTNAYRRGIPVVIVTPDGQIATHASPESRAKRTTAPAEASSDTSLPFAPPQSSNPEGDPA